MLKCNITRVFQGQDNKDKWMSRISSYTKKSNLHLSRLKLLKEI